MGIVEIAYQANTYGHAIGPVIRCAAVGTGNLLPPSKGDFDMAIGAVAAVSNDKIIAHPAPMVAFPVPAVKDGGIAGGCSRMMNDNGLQGRSFSAGGTHSVEEILGLAGETAVAVRGGSGSRPVDEGGTMTGASSG